MNKKYIVRLTEEERDQLTELVNKGQAAAAKIKHANVLLKVDADGPNWCDVQTVEALSCRARTVSNLRQRFVEQGFEAALGRKPRELACAGTDSGWREGSAPDPDRLE